MKCPSSVAHQQSRSNNEHQLPIRALLREAPHIGGETITLPRDNMMKDFLLSAQQQFAGFDAGGATGVLVVVWNANM